MKKLKRFIALLLVSLAITAPSQNLVDSLSSINGVLQPITMRGDILPVFELNLIPTSLSTPLPSSVSNDTSRFFPPIFCQTGNSCVHAAEIGYNFTYEMNRLRGVDAGSWDNHDSNLFPHLYSFNFVNGGGDVLGTPVYSGFQTVLSNGCPMYNDWCYSEGQNTSVLYWMDGYNKYYRGMKNRVVSVKKIPLGTSYYSLDKLKHWLSDHADGSSTGGVAVICLYTRNWNRYSILPNTSSHSGEYVISYLETTGGAHAMTIVGYDDNVCYDINGDSRITDEEDINHDGVVNLFDREHGALKIANSWDTTFANNGFIWLPYCLLDSIYLIDYQRIAYVCEVEERDVQLTYKATIKHSHRGLLALHVGYSTNTIDALPMVENTFNIFNNQGGDTIPMHGIDRNPVEIGLDFSSKYPNLTSYKKYFFQAVDNNNVGGNYPEGECFIKDFSLVDYRWGEIFELPCMTPIIGIEKNDTTTLSIKYDLLPFDGTPLPAVWNSDKVVRRTVNVGSNIQISNGVNMDLYGTDLYECEIYVKSNTTLTIGNGVTFTAKRGTCKVVVEGNLVLGENVRFCTENGATLELDFSGAQSVSSFIGTTFQNCDLELPKKSLSFQGCSFSETPLIMNNQYSMIPGLAAIVEGCSFVATSNQFDEAVCLKYYDSYFVKDNIIQGNGSQFKNGIYVMNCGNTNVLSVKRIINNTISDCNDYGLVFYASSGDIMNNKITGNKIGVRLLNNSNVWNFTGTCKASSPQSTQYIHDNDNIEVYIAKDCIPSLIRYNVISATSSHPYIYYDDVSSPAPMLNIDITYNNWGTGLNPVSHFVSTNLNASFNYLPLWTVGNCYDPDGNDLQYRMALADSLSGMGRYSEAKIVYKQIVNLYPSTVSAQIALKSLFNLECVSGLDYEDLKFYYLNDTVIYRDYDLSKLASSLSNRCDEFLHNYDDAITWYENVLLDTLSTFNDSIFAAIDLGNLYLRMEAMGEKGVVGKLPQYIPASREAYEKQVSYALSLLSYSRKESLNDYPTDYWMDVVTERPEGYEMDEQGNVTISSDDGLAWFAAVVNGRNGQEANDFEGKTVKLISDIDMGKHLWEAIGNSYYEDSIYFEFVQRFFKGSFDGNKHEINNLIYGGRGYLRRPYQSSGYYKYQGLFGNLYNAEVKRLKLNNFVCMNQDDMIMNFGSVASYVEQSVIDRCVSKGSIYEFYNGQYVNNREIYAGGLVYNNINSTISNCVFVADSCISYEMGGIAHDNRTTMENHRAEISNCYFYGEMYDYPLNFKGRTGHTSAGIAQYNSTNSGIEQGSIVRNCYYYPTEPRGDMVGYRAAIAWWHRGNSVIENCYYLAEHDVAFYTGVVSRPDDWATVENTSAFYYTDNGNVLEEPVEIGEEMVDDLKEALNRWVEVQQNPLDYENWCDDVWMEQGGAPMLCVVYDTMDENTEKTSLVAPNPIDNMLSIISDEMASVTVYNATGRILVKTTDRQIDMSAFRSGIYIVSITFNDGKCHLEKVIKK